MKKKSTILFIFILIFSDLYSQNINRNDTLRKGIRYGIDQSFEPYEFVDDDGKAKGFNVELIKAIGRELDMEVKIAPNNWEYFKDKLQLTDEVNVAAYYQSEEKQLKVSYSNPISLVHYSIFTSIDKEPLEHIFSLAGKIVAIQEQSIVDEYFNQLDFLGVKEIKKYNSESDAIEAVMAGEADCAITTFLTTNYKLNQENITTIQSSSDPIFITEYCYVVDVNNKALLDSLNWGLRLVKATGEYDKLYQKWLIPKKDWWERYKNLIITSVAIALAFIILVGFYIFLLRKQVNKKTERIISEMKGRVIAESELNESEALRKKIEEFSSVMLVELDLNQNILKAPKLFHSLLAFDDYSLINTSIHDLMSEEFKEKDLEIKETLIKREFNFLDTEIELIGKDKQSIWMECSTSVLFDKGSKPIGFLYFMLNVTPLKKANVNLKDMNAELASFMYKTSHDIRGPIANILGLTKLGTMTAKDKDLLKYFELIKQITYRLEHVFDDFKEVSFVLNGKLDISTFDFKELLDEVLEAIFRKREKDISKAKINVNFHLESNFISTDRILLKRLIYQIAENVFEHNNYYDTNLEITAERVNNSFYKIVFQDDGIGIPEDLHKKVFEVFFKGKSNDINIGMGLYISKKIINRLGGKLNLESAPSKGTRIEILLPLQVGELSYN